MFRAQYGPFVPNTAPKVLSTVKEEQDPEEMQMAALKEEDAEDEDGVSGSPYFPCPTTNPNGSNPWPDYPYPRRNCKRLREVGTSHPGIRMVTTCANGSPAFFVWDPLTQYKVHLFCAACGQPLRGQVWHRRVACLLEENCILQGMHVGTKLKAY